MRVAVFGFQSCRLDCRWSLSCRVARTLVNPHHLNTFSRQPFSKVWNRLYFLARGLSPAVSPCPLSWGGCPSFGEVSRTIPGVRTGMLETQQALQTRCKPLPETSQGNMITRWWASIPGLSPLGYAAMLGHEPLARLFLDHGAECFPNDRGDTPEDLARISQHYHLLPLLSTFSTWGAVNMMDSRAILRIDTGFYVTILVFSKPLCRVHVVLPCQKYLLELTEAAGSQGCQRPAVESASCDILGFGLRSRMWGHLPAVHTHPYADVYLCMCLYIHAYMHMYTLVLIQYESLVSLYIHMCVYAHKYGAWAWW